MSSFTPSVAAPSAAPDPTKHVNYTLGMILGVDDFTQEFAYLAGRDQWLARDLAGYGTVCGLRVTVASGRRGPEVVVAAGVAVSPRGQLIRVPTAQCAALNDWLALADHRELIVAQLGSPPSGQLTLSVVLRYRDCLTDQVPIPGEPCRTEEESMAASRRADDFQLELRATPPRQPAEDGLRAFVAWLSQVELSDAPSGLPSLADFEDAVRQAARPLTSPPTSPVSSSPLASSPPQFVQFTGLPPPVPAGRAYEYLRAALRVWITELRPLSLGPGQTCGTAPDEDCVLLAEVRLPLTSAPPQVNDPGQVGVYEGRRPYLLPVRFLQEWFLRGRTGARLSSPLGSGLDARSGLVGLPFVAAAGRFAADGTAEFAFGGLTATRVKAAGPVYLLTFLAYRSGNRYVVKGTPLTLLSAKAVQTVEVIPETDPGLPDFLKQTPFSAKSGIFVRVMQSTGDAAPTGFMVEISQF
jgi:hypothetical protein